MQIQNPSRFLKIASFVIALGILGGGTLLAEKNAGLFDELHPKSVGASVVAAETPETIGECEKIGRATIVGELGVIKNMKIYATKKDDLQNILANQRFEYTDVISTALEEESITLVEVQKNREYEFTVRDGEPEFWECMLTKSELFENVTIIGVNFFETNELLVADEKIEKEFEEFGYHFGAVSRVPKFLDIVELPNEIEVAKRTAYFYDRPFVRTFEIQLSPDFDYLDLKQAITDATGNLNRAAFDNDSAYTTWDDLAATIFWMKSESGDNDKVIGFVYEYKVFRHARRALKAVAENFFFVEKEVEDEVEDKEK